MGDFISSWEKVTSGVPQGSVLGPILFIIFINEISELLMSINELYADDTKLIKEINSEYDAIMLQDDID
jgi:retron-type reverse transcriptase